MPESSRRRQVVNPFQGQNSFRRSRGSRRSVKERILNPFNRGERPLWLKIVWTPIDILLVVILLPIVVVLVPLVGCVIVPLLFVFAAISGMVSRDRNDNLEVQAPPAWSIAFGRVRRCAADAMILNHDHSWRGRDRSAAS